MTYSKGRQNDIKTYFFNDIFYMGFVGCGLRWLMYFCLIYTPTFLNQTTKYVIKEICLYVILSKLSSFCLAL